MSATENAVAGKSVTINELKPVDVRNLPAIRSGFDTLQTFELMQRQAKLLSASSLVPEQYRNNLSNCVIALNMAQRIGADPLMVMQNLYVVHGRPGWSAQFLIACFNQCGRFAAIRYRFSGSQTKDDWNCRAYSKELATGDNIEGPEISIALAKKEGWYQKNGSKWQSIPQLMLMYRAASWLVRTHAPEIAMGLQTDEELHDVYDAQRDGQGRYAVELESLRQQETTLTPAADEPATLPSPQYDEAGAISALKESGDATALSEAWDDIVADYEATRRDIPPSVDEAFKTCKAKLSKL